MSVSLVVLRFEIEDHFPLPESLHFKSSSSKDKVTSTTEKGKIVLLLKVFLVLLLLVLSTKFYCSPDRTISTAVHFR